MKPVDQRYWRPECREVGDCLAACVASMFELDLDEMPHLMRWAILRHERHLEEGPASWWGPLNDWASDFGLGVNALWYPRERRKPRSWHPGWWIAIVRSRSSDPTVDASSSHAVLMWANELRHDPNPDSRDWPEPYRYRGEIWFEVYEPKVLYDAIDWRVVLEKTRLSEAS